MGRYVNYVMLKYTLFKLMITFTLSLYKLYSSVPFIVKDYPIQTMDDILRHNFNNHFMVLSPHETDYESC